MKQNKKYVITGATSGIGNALARKLAARNTVFAGYRNKKHISALEKISPNIIPFYVNFEEKESPARAADYIKSRTERIDTLFNAAGCVIGGAMENIDADDIRKQFEVNVFSHLEFSRNLMPLIKDKIINISSMASFAVFPFVAPYCASKRSLDILFNLMQIEISRKSSLKIISVKPGVIATPLWEKSIELNKKSMEKAKSDYGTEMEYIAETSRKNQKNGLNVDKAADLIIKIDSHKHPKTSYTIGLDAKIAGIISKLPQGFVNYLIKRNLRKILNKK